MHRIFRNVAIGSVLLLILAWSVGLLATSFGYLPRIPPMWVGQVFSVLLVTAVLSTIGGILTLE